MAHKKEVTNSQPPAEESPAKIENNLGREVEIEHNER